MSSSSCCCGCLRCCCYSFAALLGVLFPFGVTILIYWAIFQPHQIHATVASATLTGLAVTNNASAVSYRLNVSLDIYNPSLRVGIYYDTMDTDLRFHGASLGGASTPSPPEFYQRRKSWKTVTVEFDGSGVGVPGDVAGELEKEIGLGSVSLEVAVDARVRYKLDGIKIRQKPKVWCSVTIPVKPDQGRGVSGALASGDRCSVKY